MTATVGVTFSRIVNGYLSILLWFPPRHIPFIIGKIIMCTVHQFYSFSKMFDFTQTNNANICFKRNLAWLFFAYFSPCWTLVSLLNNEPGLYQSPRDGCFLREKSQKQRPSYERPRRSTTLRRLSPFLKITAHSYVSFEEKHAKCQTTQMPVSNII